MIEMIRMIHVHVFCLQVICKQNLSKSGRDNLVTEIALLKKLKHKFIVDLIDFHWDDKYIYIGKHRRSLVL